MSKARNDGSLIHDGEDMEERLGKRLDEVGLETELKDIYGAAAKDLTGTDDPLLLGCPVYSNDAVELTEDFEAFHDELGDAPSSVKLFAVFVPGDGA